MPFSAIINGERCVSVLMSEEAWLAAKQVKKANEQDLLIGYSHLPGYARVSSTGLRHFAHRQGYRPDVEWAETPEHLAMKAALVQLLHEQGWQVDTEVPSPERDWIADVLAEKAGRKIAFEVQWSSQSAEKYMFRQARYRAAGVECVWVARHEVNVWDLTAAEREVFQAIPIFYLTDAAAITANIKAKQVGMETMGVLIPTAGNNIIQGPLVYTLAEMVGGVVNDDIRVVPSFELNLYQTGCWKCHNESLYWCVGRSVMWADRRPEEDDHILEAVVRYRYLFDANIPLAKIDLRGSRTVPEPYKAFICPHCDAMQGSFYEGRNLMDAYNWDLAVDILIPVTKELEAFVRDWQIVLNTTPIFYL